MVKESEKMVEEYLRTEIRKAGGRAYKFTSPGNVGVPDRIVIMPCGNIVFVELKSNGGKPSQLQRMKIKELKDLGCSTTVIGSRAQVNDFITALQSDLLGCFIEKQDELYGI